MKSSKHVLSAGLRARILKAILWPKIQRRYVAKATKSSANTADKLGELRAKMGIINELPITKALNRKFNYDIIAYIGPSLQKHKNCDILDINPGIGIWSSELHNFLQPRSHILLESQPEFYKPFLEELSNKPGSKYKLLIGDTGDFATYERLINEGQFPNQTRLNPGDPRLNQLNNTLLVTGSFAYDPVMPGLGFSSMARQVFSQFAKSAWSNELFHAYGHVRMLLWATTDDSQFLVPRSVTQPQKFPMLLQKICTTNVIASPISLPRVSGRQGASRDFRTELEGSAQVFAAMQRAGLEIPVHRRDALCTFAHKFFGKFAANSDLGVQGSLDALIEFERQGMSMQGLLPETVREQVALEEEIAKGIRKEFEIKPVTSTKKPKPILSVDGKRLARLRIQNRAAQKKREMRSALVDKAEEIYQMECFVLTTKSKAGKRETKAKLDVLNAEYKTEKNALNRLDQSLVDTEFDDRLAVRSPLHRLEWDKRSFEPLLIHDNEVWPNSRTALLDMTPKPRPEGESFRDVEYYQDILIPILANGSLTVPQALGSIAPGASQLIEEVPALRDPAKGGRLNMDHFRARMLRGEILDGLVKAYREWPFRPPETDHPKYFQAMSTGTLMLDRR